MKNERPFRGMNLRKSLQWAQRNRCAVEALSASGEKRVRHPLLGSSGKFDARRKDTPEHLRHFLVRVWEFENRKAA